MTTINHLFWGDSILLVSQMIEKILNHSRRNHFFIIMINSLDTIHRYDELFRRNSTPPTHYRYLILNGSRNYLKESIAYLNLLRNGVFLSYSFVKDWLRISDEFVKLDVSNLIIHFEISQYALFFLKKKFPIVWVCWGNIPQYNPNARLIRLRRSFYYKKFIEQCYKVVALTPSDKKAIEETFHVNNVVCASYSYIYDYDGMVKTCHKNNRVLIGNSAFFLKEYDYVAKLLQSVSGLDVTFMCSYGRPNLEIYNEWKMRIKQNLEPNNSVSFWEENIPINEYNRRIGEYRVYIAGMERQSGLGAITTAIGSGLKVYITGVNYDYFSEKGLSVCKIEELQEIDLDKLLYFDEKEKQENIAKVKEVCGVNESFSAWERIYDSL